MLTKYKANMVYQLFTTRMRQLYRILNRRRKKAIQGAFNRVKDVCQGASLERELKEYKDKIENEFSLRLNKKEGDILGLSKRIEELSNSVLHYKNKEAELVVKLKNKEKQIGVLENEIANTAVVVTSNNGNGNKGGSKNKNVEIDPSEVRLLEQHVRKELFDVFSALV